MKYKIPVVECLNPEDLQLISFKVIRKWNFPIFTGFQYDFVTDDDIYTALVSVSKADIDIDWEDDDGWGDDNTTLNEFHAGRIAALVLHLMNNGSIYPVELDTFFRYECCSCISNGHHRLRALEFLGYTHFPAYCSGLTSEINPIIDKKVTNDFFANE